MVVNMNRHMVKRMVFSLDKNCYAMTFGEDYRGLYVQHIKIHLTLNELDIVAIYC
jgi:hypothetical protein